MFRWTHTVLGLALLLSAAGQSDWVWTELPSMPFESSNNAVAVAEVNGVKHVYSFAGLDSTKHLSGIHLKAARYNTQSAIWQQIADVPDTLGKVAAAASTVGNVIYVIGGYHVFDGTPFELSSNKVHRYDAQNDLWLSDGADIPVAIDDQVQVVWRDSLIFVVTGWSDNTNVDEVQIYDPANDVWRLGTPVPNNSQYKVFGASGCIIGDTIFYYGGASAGFNFPAQKRLRKGVIDPNDPTNITWSVVGLSPFDNGYRTASVCVGGHAFWIGGSATSYNYDGIAYNGSGGVEPLERILQYTPASGQWQEGLGAPYGVMDLRQAAQLAPNEFVIAGSMMAGQLVTDRVFHLEYTGTTGQNELGLHPGPKPFPNPSQGKLQLDLGGLGLPTYVAIHSSDGRLMHTSTIYQEWGVLNLEGWPEGAYFLQLEGRKGRARSIFHLVD